MPAWALIVIVLVVVVAVAATIVIAIVRQRRTAALRDQFGPEYARTVRSRTGRRAAESELLGRQRQRATLDITPLPAATRLRYREQWRAVQERFVDQPAEALGSADRLLHQVMADLGYPVGDFASQSDLISVDHPETVENYRVAHATYERTDTGPAGTEELRDALLRYRSLFDELLDAGQQDGQLDEAAADETATDETATDETVADETAADETALSGAQTVPAQPIAGDYPTEPEAGHDPG
jgi:hypothetical protein